jgi:ribonuclease HI
MSQNLDEFQAFREKLNEKILDAGNLEIKRFFALDRKVYSEGALSAKTKELLGLTASFVLRCDDCIAYHLIQAKKENVSDAELYETMSIALVVGGSIIIPHLRRAVDFWEEISDKSNL